MTVFNLPTWITLSRIFITPAIIALLYFPGKAVCLFATVLYAIASLSDFIDGRLARNYNQVTSFGKFLDPLADKVLNCSVLIMFAALNWVTAWVVIVILCRELLVTGLRAVAADEGYVMAADKLGKLKTTLQGMAIVPLMLHYSWFGISAEDIKLTGDILLYAALLLTVVSGINYLVGFYRFWMGKHSG